MSETPCETSFSAVGGGVFAFSCPDLIINGYEDSDSCAPRCAACTSYAGHQVGSSEPTGGCCPAAAAGLAGDQPPTRGN